MSHEVKAETHKLVASVVSWSMKIALDGSGPSHGYRGEELVGNRRGLAGQSLADGLRFAYFGFKADAKARKECHTFDRSYQHNQICETCFAERPNKKGNPLLVFKNFADDAAYLMTELSHDEYVQSTRTPSPWLEMPAFHVKTAFRDPMHTVFLGSAKELLASCLGYWHRTGRLPGSNLQEQLRGVSRQQQLCCRGAGLRSTFKTFTPANTGLDTPANYPELGSSFKAATMKLSIWFFSVYASQIASDAEDTGYTTVAPPTVLNF